MDRLLGAQYGPMTTLGRNVTSATSAIAGLVFLVLPMVQRVPLPDQLYFGGMGLILVGVFFFNAFRWRPLMARAAREARSAGASSSFVFVQAHLSGPGAREARNIGAGWAMMLGERMVVTFRRSSVGVGARVERLEIPLAEIAKASRREGTSMSYPTLVMAGARSSREMTFTLVSRNASGLRGPSDEDVDAVAAEINEHIATQTDRAA